MARAFGVGTETSPSFEETVPTGVIEPGTSANQLSSCCERRGPLSVYHEPACVALRVTILAKCKCEDTVKDLLRL